MSTLSEGYIQTQNSPKVQLHYVEAVSKDEAPLIVLLHGFPEYWYAWNDYLEPLKDAGFHALALDLRGYNLSSHPQEIEEYHLDRLIKDIEVVVRKYNKRTFLVGHDWGGIITWKFASRFPELLGGIVVLNAPHPNAFRKNLNFKQMLKSWYTYAFQLPVLPEFVLKRRNLKAVQQIFQSQAQTPDAYTEDDIAKYKMALSEGETLSCAVNYYRANLKDFTKEQLAPIPLPTLVLWGEKDAALERSLNDGLEEFIEGRLTKKFYPEASHWLHREMPSEVIKEIKNFILR